MGGVEATRRIATSLPDVQVVILTSFDDRSTVGEALDAGAIGYLLKDSDPATLRDGIESAARGGSPLNPRVARTMLAARREQRAEPSLTDREREVLELLRRGLANKEIATSLGITVKTVKAHLTSLFQKVGVLDRPRRRSGQSGSPPTDRSRLPADPAPFGGLSPPARADLPTIPRARR